jgi:hypothetical protein
VGSFLRRTYVLSPFSAKTSFHLTSCTLQFRRDLSLGEIQYIWADPSQPNQQAALSSIVQAMLAGGKEVMAIARWVTKDGMDPKMGVLSPVMFDKVECLLWAQVRQRSINREKRLKDVP